MKCHELRIVHLNEPETERERERALAWLCQSSALLFVVVVSVVRSHTTCVTSYLCCVSSRLLCCLIPVRLPHNENSSLSCLIAKHTYTQEGHQRHVSPRGILKLIGTQQIRCLAHRFWGPKLQGRYSQAPGCYRSY